MRIAVLLCSLSISTYAAANPRLIHAVGKSQTCFDYSPSTVFDGGGSAEENMKIEAEKICGVGFNAVQISVTELLSTSVCTHRYGESYSASAVFECVQTR